MMIMPGNEVSSLHQGRRVGAFSLIASTISSTETAAAIMQEPAVNGIILLTITA